MPTIYSVEGNLLGQSNKRIRCSHESPDTFMQGGCPRTHLINHFVVMQTKPTSFTVSGRSYPCLSKIGVDADGWYVRMTSEPQILGRSAMPKTYYEAYCPEDSVNAIAAMEVEIERDTRAVDGFGSVIERLERERLEVETRFENETANAQVNGIPTAQVTATSIVEQQRFAESNRQSQIQSFTPEQREANIRALGLEPDLQASLADQRQHVREGIAAQQQRVNVAQRTTTETAERFVRDNPAPNSDGIWDHHKKGSRL